MYTGEDSLVHLKSRSISLSVYRLQTDPLVRPTLRSNFLEGNTIPILRAGTVPHYLEIYLRSSDKISRSWIAQACHLDTSLRTRGYVDEDSLYQIYGSFTFRIEPLDKYESFHLCDTFMIEDPHTLSLFIRPPVVDYSSHEVSIPVLSWLYDEDSEISLEEAEEVFGFKLITSWKEWSLPCSSVFTAIPELNAEYGFNPAKGGADVCERHGWPILELFDTSKSIELEEWTTSNAVSESLEPASVHRNMYPRYSGFFTVVVNAISILLLALIVQVYLYQ
ncbi:hypothetical protein EDD18DRAFT_172124 [Armillaria luteobubalina]|uniref:Uncharacterized protein n=1 Tax=Armillaria luteobubalina TaxID=153913 RepID=A0AA39Q6H3_9AGAR|nr:hypothetical protein EDD18DRAFT_172124 [Armillaria luteobubalina]